MVRHDAISEQANIDPIESLGEDAHEGFIVGRFGKDGSPSDGSIEHMIDVTAGDMT